MKKIIIILILISLILLTGCGELAHRSGKFYKACEEECSELGWNTGEYATVGLQSYTCSCKKSFNREDGV